MDKKAQQSMEQVGCMSKREKFWSEIDDTAKIERMRQVVKGLVQELDNLREENLRLRHHLHAVGGAMVVPFTINESFGRFSPRAEQNEGEVYF